MKFPAPWEGEPRTVALLSDHIGAHRATQVFTHQLHADDSQTSDSSVGLCDTCLWAPHEVSQAVTLCEAAPSSQLLPTCPSSVTIPSACLSHRHPIHHGSFLITWNPHTPNSTAPPWPTSHYRSPRPVQQPLPRSPPPSLTSYLFPLQLPEGACEQLSQGTSFHGSEPSVAPTFSRVKVLLTAHKAPHNLPITPPPHSHLCPDRCVSATPVSVFPKHTRHTSATRPLLWLFPSAGNILPLRSSFVSAQMSSLSSPI